MLVQLEAQERREARRDEKHQEHGRRIKALELLAAKAAGASVVISACVGFLASIVRSRML